MQRVLDELPLAQPSPPTSAAASAVSTALVCKAALAAVAAPPSGQLACGLYMELLQRLPSLVRHWCPREHLPCPR
jgi:hypothetical protein